jgi:hypothetical protein
VQTVSSRRAETRTVPPSMRCAMPWRTAFSISGCSRSGGTLRLSVSSSTSVSTRRPGAEAHLLDGEERFGEIELLAERDLLLRAEPRLLRRKPASSRHMRRAACGPSR